MQSCKKWRFRKLIAVRVLSPVKVVLSSVLNFSNLVREQARQCWPQTSGRVDTLNERDVFENTFFSCLSRLEQ